MVVGANINVVDYTPYVRAFQSKQEPLVLASLADNPAAIKDAGKKVLDTALNKIPLSIDGQTVLGAKLFDHAQKELRLDPHSALTLQYLAYKGIKNFPRDPASGTFYLPVSIKEDSKKPLNQSKVAEALAKIQRNGGKDLSPLLNPKVPSYAPPDSLHNPYPAKINEPGAIAVAQTPKSEVEVSDKGVLFMLEELGYVS